MYKQDSLSFLQQCGFTSSYQIWLMCRESMNFQLVEGDKELGDFTFQDWFPVDKKSDALLLKGDTYFIFNYPEFHQMVVRIPGKHQLSRGDLNHLYYHLYPYYTKYALERSNYKIDKMIDTIGRTNSSLDLEELFPNILSNTLDVIPNADLGTLWQFDDQIGRLVCTASVGNLLEGIKNMQFEIGEGPIGRTYQIGKPVFYKESSEMRDSANLLSPENTVFWDKNYDLEQRVKSVVTCPILVGGRIECVMFLCQINKEQSLTEQDLHLLEGFSAQVGIAIQNARQYTDIKELNEILIERDNIQATLSKLSIQNMGVNKIIREINRMICKPVVFVDLVENECFPTKKTLPRNMTFKDLHELLSSDHEKTYYEFMSSGNISNYIYPIRSAALLLGCLVIEANSPMQQLDYIVLEQAHSVLALELARKQSLVEFYYKKQRELFTELLQTNDHTIITKNAIELGIEDDQDYVTVIFQFSDYSSPQILEAHVHRLIAQIKKDLFSYIQFVFGYHDEVTLLVFVPDQSQLERFQKQLSKLMIDWMKNKEIILRAGIGTVYNGIYVIEKSYREAKTALSYLQSRHQNGSIQYSNIGVNRLFINQDVDELKSFLNEVFEPLRTPQGINNTLEQTLITYFQTNRSAGQTALLMHVHINTMYQRLKKIEELLQVSFQNTEDVLRLQLACYLKESFKLI